MFPVVLFFLKGHMLHLLLVYSNSVCPSLLYIRIGLIGPENEDICLVLDNYRGRI